MRTLWRSRPARLLSLILFALAGALSGGHHVSAQTPVTGSSASLQGQNIVVTFTGAVSCPSNSCTGFTISSGNGTTASTTGSVNSQNPSQIDLPYSTTYGTQLTVSYNGGNVTNVYGQPVPAFSLPVTNGNGSGAVTFSGASVSGTVLIVTFSGNVYCPANSCQGFSVQGSDGTTYDPSGSAYAGSNASNQLDIQLTNTPPAGTTLTLTYTPGNVADAQGQPVGGFTETLSSTGATPTATACPVGTYCPTVTPVPQNNAVATATINGNVVTVNFNGPVTCSNSACYSFFVEGSDNSNYLPGDSGQINPSNPDQILLTLTATPPSGVALNLTYTPGDVVVSGTAVATFGVTVAPGSGYPTPTPTATVPVSAAITLNPTIVQVGTGAPITVSGSGFAANESILVSYPAIMADGTSLPEQAFTTANASGAFSNVQLNVPTALAGGPYLVTARGQTSTRTATATFTATAPTPTPRPTVNLPPPPPPPSLATATPTPLPSPTPIPPTATPIPPAQASIVSLHAQVNGHTVKAPRIGQKVAFPVRVRVLFLPVNGRLHFTWQIMKNGRRKVAHHGYHQDLAVGTTGTFGARWVHVFKYGGKYSITVTVELPGWKQQKTITVKVPYRKK